MSATSAEAFERAGRVADAVLYEGYVLYPYRASSAKNQVRWQFGVLAPRAFSETDGSEQWFQQTECIAEIGLEPRVDLRVRFLQVQARTVEAAIDGGYQPVAQLDVGDDRWTTWEEAVERQVDLVGIDLSRSGRTEAAISLPAFREEERLGDAGRIVRERWPAQGVVKVEVEDLPGPYPLVRLQVRVHNITDWAEQHTTRDQVVRRALVGVHVLAHTDDATFVSSLDPPEFARAAVSSCTNTNTFPVLIGDEGDDTTVLSSPIILYDRPEVAAESPGDMCDATEIDEILALRVLTLTDEEKRDARSTDARAAAIVDRVDDFAPEIFERLHGAIRSLRPAEPEPLPWWEPAVDASFDPWSDAIRIGGVEVQKGVKVKLRPGRRRADAQDIFLTDKTATVEGVFSDVDGEHHVAVTLDDDPAADLYQTQGRFLYFHPDEVEPVR